MSKDSSPDFLVTSPEVPGVRRLNDLPRYVMIAVIIVVGAIIVRGAIKSFEEPEKREVQEEKQKKLDSFASPPVTKPDGPDVMIPPAPPPEIFSVPAPAAYAPPAQPQLSEHDRRRIEAYNNAINAPTRVDSFSKMRAEDVQQPAQTGQASANVERQMGDQNMQQEKREFLDSFSKETSPYLKQTRIPAVSPYEIKAGTIIPGVLVSGINSDLPGQIIGRVTRNVYDSATGRHLLIPAGATLIGSYDSMVAAGQERVLTAWPRLVFPDSSSINLEGMPGADQSGFAGFNDQVDNHYWRTFGNAALLSLFSAGVQLSQPRGAVQGTYNSQQIMAAEIGRQLGRLGMQLTQRNLNIQPTLVIRPGFKFSVMVTKDMILPPWKG